MADNLTVKSRPDAPPASAPAPAPHTDEKTAEELRALRALVRSRTGREVGDAVLEQVRERRHARLTHAARQAEAKASFETTAARESLGSSSDARDVQARRAVGASEVKTPDGLTEKDRAEVRGNLDAGPRLPPATSKTTSPEQAATLCDRIFEHLLLDGRPIDARAYAAGLQERPAAKGTAPTTTRSPARGAGGPATSAPATGAPAASGPARSFAPSPTASASSAAAAKPGTTSGPSRPAPGLPGGAPVASPALSLRLGGPDRPQTRAPAAGAGGGGALTSRMPFDGLHFNWDAFLMQFMISTAEDLGLWRKMLRELRDLAGKATLLAMKVDEENTKAQHELEMIQTGAELTKGVLELGKQMKNGEADAMGGRAPGKVPAHEDALRKLLDDPKLPPGTKGRLLLTPDEVAKLPADKRVQYERLRHNLERDAGRITYAALLRAELASLGEAPAGTTQNLTGELEGCERDVAAYLARRGNDPVSMQRLRAQLTAGREVYNDRARKAEAALAAAPTAGEARTKAGNERAAALTALVEHDDELFRVLATPGVKQVLTAEAAALGPGDTRERLEQAVAGKTPPLPEASAATAQPARLERLAARAAAGDHLMKAVEKAGPSDGPAWMRAAAPWVDLASNIATGWANDAELAQVMNEAAQRAMQSARERRVELDQLIQQATREAQGMLNQLLVTGLHRT